jgi:hypothetical protein
MGMTRSINKPGISQMSCDLTSELYMEVTSKRRVKNTNTAIATIETFTLTFPIFIKKIICG